MKIQSAASSARAVGGVAPYIAMGALSATARGVKMLDSPMSAIPGVRALSAAAQPIRYGAAREMLRYSPLELSRLGIGFAMADSSDDYGNMLADVGLMTMLTGTVGGIGGFFRAGGTVAPETGKVVGSDFAFKPTFALRMSRGEGAQVTGDLPLGDVQNALMKEVFTERIGSAAIQGLRPRYVAALEGGTPETDALVNSLFRPSSGKAGSLVRKPLMDKNGLWTIDDVAQAELLGGLGMKDMAQLAENAVYPRLININSQRAAGALVKTLDDSPALQFVGDGVMMAREAGTGLYMVAKRLKTGADDPLAGAVAALEDAAAALRPEASKVIEGATRVREGDQWFIAMTDKPQVFIPEAHKVAELNVAQWAKYREPFRPSASPDIFNRQSNLLNDVFTPRDFAELKTTTRASFVTNMTEKLATKFANVTGLKGSETYRRMANALYDTVKPSMFLENQSPLFQRLFAHLRNNMRTADETVNRIMGGAIKVTGLTRL